MPDYDGRESASGIWVRRCYCAGVDTHQCDGRLTHVRKSRLNTPQYVAHRSPPATLPQPTNAPDRPTGMLLAQTPPPQAPQAGKGPEHNQLFWRAELMCCCGCEIAVLEPGPGFGTGALCLGCSHVTIEVIDESQGRHDPVRDQHHAGLLHRAGDRKHGQPWRQRHAGHR